MGFFGTSFGDTRKVTCHFCDGTGHAKNIQAENDIQCYGCDRGIRTERYVKCSSCNGTKKVDGKDCYSCNGNGGEWW